MTNVAIDQLTLRCHAEAGSDQRALATRRRLENIARSFLPDALEQSLGDLDVSLDRIDVAIDFDVTQYDDPTVATLWASRVRTAITEHRPSGNAGRQEFAATASHPRASDIAEAGEVDLCVHLAMEAAAGATEHFPRLIAMLRREWLASRLFKALEPSQRRAVLEALVTWLRLRTEALHPNRNGGEPMAEAEAELREQLGRFTAATAGRTGIIDERDWRQWWQLADRAALDSTPPGSAAPPTAQRIEEPPQPLHAEPELHTSLFVSDAGGLVLMWPWLRKLSTMAEEIIPEDPVAARRLALAAAAGAGNADPLVALLAGAPPNEGPPPIEVTTRQAQAIDEAAEWCVARFTAAIPGFEKSSRQFIVDGLLRRRAQFGYDEDNEAVSVRIEPRPLDVVLDRLPYPLAVVRLPWTPLISIDRGA